jgi:hypothetical protein
MAINCGTMLGVKKTISTQPNGLYQFYPVQGSGSELLRCRQTPTRRMKVFWTGLRQEASAYAENILVLTPQKIH